MEKIIVKCIPGLYETDYYVFLSVKEGDIELRRLYGWIQYKDNKPFKYNKI